MILEHRIYVTGDRLDRSSLARALLQSHELNPNLSEIREHHPTISSSHGTLEIRFCTDGLRNVGAVVKASEAYPSLIFRVELVLDPVLAAIERATFIAGEIDIPWETTPLDKIATHSLAPITFPSAQ